MGGEKRFSLVWTEENVKPEDTAFEGSTAAIYASFEEAFEHAVPAKGQVDKVSLD